jgi:hypothetical protein
VCAHNREFIFGEIADACLKGIPKNFNNILLDKYIIMPNHIHKIIIINSNCRGEVASPPLNASMPIKQGGETPPLRMRGDYPSPNIFS